MDLKHRITKAVLILLLIILTAAPAAAAEAGSAPGESGAAAQSGSKKQEKKPYLKRKGNKIFYYGANGKVDRTFTGFAAHGKKICYVEKGVVTGKRTGLVRGTIDGVRATWYVKRSRVDYQKNGIVANRKGRWYVRKGRVRGDFTGKKKIGKFTYTIKKGKVLWIYEKAARRLNRIGHSLKAAFRWSAGMRYFGHNSQMPSSPKKGVNWFANYGFKHHKGNCYVMACTFYQMAIELGYDARVMTGKVPLRRGGLGPHSWVEIKIRGRRYVFDPNYTNETGRNGYKIYYGKSGTWRYQSYRVMT